MSTRKTTKANQATKKTSAASKPPITVARASKRPITKAAQRRIQSAEAKANGGKVKKGSFASRVQRMVDKP